MSLSQIPPELEQQLEFRLKKELWPEVLKQAREQSEQVLEAAKAAIEQKTTETHGEFLRRVALDLQAVEQRTQGLSTDVAQNLREHLNRGLGELHQEVADAGNRLKRMSADLLGRMENRLGRDTRCAPPRTGTVSSPVAAESSRLQEQIANLDRRMTDWTNRLAGSNPASTNACRKCPATQYARARSQLESCTRGSSG